MSYSFFYTRGGAGEIRGRQMADYLGGKHNPKRGYENDVCIFVKTTKPPFLSKRSYIDVLDAPRAVDFLKIHPEIGVIACGDYHRYHLVKVLDRKDVNLIPHHHCNFDREVRPDRPVKVVGIMGMKNAFQHPIDDVRKRLREMGLELKYEPDYWDFYKEDRQKIVDFYKDIDIQIVWRPSGWSPRYGYLRSPLKLSNAGSFGIPTVSFPEPDYVKEWSGADCIYENNIDDFFRWVKMLKESEHFYRAYAKGAYRKAEKYHISNMDQYYSKL